MTEVFLKIVNLSISASYLVAAVLLLRLVLKKAPKWINVLLWGLVAIRLILPISIESAFSLIPSAETIPEQVIAGPSFEVQTGIPQIDAPVNDYIGDHYFEGVTVPAEQGFQTISLLTVLWLAGMVAMLLYTAVSYFLLRQKVATAVRLRDNIYRSENVDSPFVLGFLGPKIYLPFRMDGRDLAHVIAHEEAHIRRKDHWWKPMGFVLLAIHWFNPMMWVGYILLCRDIELACDEKVIQKMDNETKADYSEALVACSANRRRIAACPLAFGEVGVKERVKTVMNYKKPAFWIVIAAVALCIVVAVSFLTNPKDYGPAVGNPKMLEFPGVEWFVTPDELKEALNITEEQILHERMEPEKPDVGNDYDTYYLSVKDLTLFGRDVSYAFFQFRRYPGFDFAFDHVIAMFDEDTDMVKLKEEVSEIYGPAADANDTYYIYYTDEKTEHTYSSRMQEELEYSSKVGPERYGLEDNPWQDALDDPDYMIHHWVPENGLPVIPEEVVEWYQYMMNQPWNADHLFQDDDVLMEWLDQFPWYMIAISNRCAATITRDARGVEDDQSSSSYYTNNYMEFSAMNLWYYYFASQGTGNNATEQDKQSVPAPEVGDPTMLEFPGIQWNATPEEVKKSLGLTTDQILVDMQIEDSELMDTWGLTATEVPFFGEEVVQAQFLFSKYSGYDNFGLDSVRLYYPDEVDMSEVRDTLISIYGTGNSKGIKRYSIANGKVHYSVDDKLHANVPDALLYCWESSSKGTDVLPQEIQEAIIAVYADPEFDNIADRDVVLEYLEKSPLVTLYCTDSAGEGNLSADDLYTCNHVNFSAAAYIDLIQRYGK